MSYCLYCHSEIRSKGQICQVSPPELGHAHGYCLAGQPLDSPPATSLEARITAIEEQLRELKAARDPASIGECPVCFRDIYVTADSPAGIPCPRMLRDGKPCNARCVP